MKKENMLEEIIKNIDNLLNLGVTQLHLSFMDKNHEQIYVNKKNNKYTFSLDKKLWMINQSKEIFEKFMKRYIDKWFDEMMIEPQYKKRIKRKKDVM